MRRLLEGNDFLRDEHHCFSKRSGVYATEGEDRVPAGLPEDLEVHVDAGQ